MSIDCHDLLFFAEEMLEHSSSEVEWRCCASRAYYCGYHSAKTIDIEDDKDLAMGAHQRLIYLLSKHDDPRIRRLSKMLNPIKRLRVAADYELDEGFPREDAEMTLRLVQELVEKTKAVLPNLSGDIERDQRS